MSKRRHHAERVQRNRVKSLGSYWQPKGMVVIPGKFVKNKAFGCSCHRCRAWNRAEKYNRKRDPWLD